LFENIINFVFELVYSTYFHFCSNMSAAEKRLQEAESLQTTLTFHQEGSGSLLRSCIAILKSLLECSSTVGESNETDASTAGLGLSNLVLLLDRDETQLRTIALPTSLAILNRVATSGLITEESSISRFVKLIHGLCAGSLAPSSSSAIAPGAGGGSSQVMGHPQSVLRSGILASICQWIDAGLLQSEEKGLVMETILLCIEELRSREDAALILSLSRRFFDTIETTYPDFSCTSILEISDDKTQEVSTVIIRKSPLSSPIMLEHSCRCVARLLSILSRLAEGHWKHWKAAYTFNQVSSNLYKESSSISLDVTKRKTTEKEEEDNNDNEDEEDEEGTELGRPERVYSGTPVPANWALQAIAHLWKMGAPNLLSRALAGHCAFSAPGVQSDSFSIEGNGIGITRYTIRAILRALARTLMVLCEHQRLSSFKPAETSSSRTISIPLYSAEVPDLIDKCGLGGLLLRIMSISAAKDLSQGKEPLPALNSGHVRDPETIEDCLLLLASLFPRSFPGGEKVIDG